ncbi:hypothetical protein EAN93_27185 [Klebsiella pneumoniae]|nr:hypothetical protein EAN93_27185 [Klebsiella pneumoniae]
MSGQGCSRQPLAACGTNWPRAKSCRLRAARSGCAVKTVAASNRRFFGVGLANQLVADAHKLRLWVPSVLRTPARLTAGVNL